MVATQVFSVLNCGVKTGRCDLGAQKIDLLGGQPPVERLGAFQRLFIASLHALGRSSIHVVALPIRAAFGKFLLQMRELSLPQGRCHGDDGGHHVRKCRLITILQIGGHLTHGLGSGRLQRTGLKFAKLL